MERLKLDVLALVSQQIHHDFQVVLRRDIAGHDVEIRPVEQNLAQ